MVGSLLWFVVTTCDHCGGWVRTNPDANWFAEELTRKFLPSPGAEAMFVAVGGRVYDRILGIGENGAETGVHAFVHRDSGAVFKPAGRTKPAIGARFPSVRSAAAVADPFGSYLYVR